MGGIEMFKQGKKYKIGDLPTEIDILGIQYTIGYHSIPNDVDAEKRKSLFGQTDCWNRTIRIYYTDRPIEDVFLTLLHEILHVLDGELEMDLFSAMGENEEKSINILALGLFNVFSKNNWLHFPGVK